MADFYYRRLKPRWQQMNGYHFAILSYTCAVAGVLILNLAFTIWATIKFGVHDGLGTLQDGDCTETKHLTFWLHLGINILSTILLGASNYTMQCLSSPTRSEIDKAHNKGTWLDVGVPSVRNLTALSRYRIVLWWLLAASSIPLHLLYNSAIFSSLSTREFGFTVASEFPSPAACNASFYFYQDDLTNRNVDISGDAGYNFVAQVLQEAQQPSTLSKKVGLSTCIKDISAPIISAYSNVFFVTSHDSTQARNSSILLRYGICDSMVWAPSEESPGCPDYGVWGFANYCLYQPIEEHCRLQFSLAIMLIVIVCNVMKAACMGMIIWKYDQKPLVTLGDAITSFLEVRDQVTKGNCLGEKSHFDDSNDWKRGLLRWTPKPRYWYQGASIGRWYACNLLCILTLITASALLSQGFERSLYTIQQIWSLGFGNVNPDTIIDLGNKNVKSVIFPILLANSPQLLLTFLYFTYNGIFTCMLLGEEWSGYATKRRPLRVSSPSGKQRSTYYLQLPYHYSVPLLILSMLLHWLVSQSLFLVKVTGIDRDGIEESALSISSCGYSPAAILIVIVLGAVCLLGAIVIGCQKFSSGMPFAGSCSAAISAACHPPKEDVSASKDFLMWGVIPEEYVECDGTRMKHCSFTSLKVDSPVEGEVYA